MSIMWLLSCQWCHDTPDYFQYFVQLFNCSIIVRKARDADARFNSQRQPPHHFKLSPHHFRLPPHCPPWKNNWLRHYSTTILFSTPEKTDERWGVETKFAICRQLHFFCSYTSGLRDCTFVKRCTPKIALGKIYLNQLLDIRKTWCCSKFQSMYIVQGACRLRLKSLTTCFDTYYYWVRYVLSSNIM